jgi:sodium-independent sulfate anion transporter 11
MSMGIYGLVIGLLKLGFLLEFISLPILTGFISAVAIVIILHQLDSLLGEPGTTGHTAKQIDDVFRNLPQANGYACAIGFTGILLLVALEQAGKRWGQKNKVIWFFSITRAFVALVIFTGVGYAVNKPRGDPNNFLFEVTQVQGSGQEPPRVPSARLVSKVLGRSITVFIGSAVEHTSISRAFGVRNHYVPDQSQELTFYGVANIANSAFHAIGVGGAMSRSAVNNACNVKSPLSGFVTTAVVLVSIFKLMGTLYWIPQATLSAIIITACWPLISSPSVFYQYWRISLADFVSSMIAFWVSLFVSTGIGIGSSIGFNIAYVILRQVFTRVSTVPESELEAALNEARNIPSSVPPSTRVFQLNDSLFFPNAYRVKTAIIETIKTRHAPVFNSAESPEAERNWSVTREKRLAKLRRRAGVTDTSALPPINHVIIDFRRTNHIDMTACSHLEALVSEIRAHGGLRVQICFVGLSEYVQRRFKRAGWTIVPGNETREILSDEKVVRSYPSVACAVASRQRGAPGGAAEGEEEERKSETDANHVEQAAQA